MSKFFPKTWATAPSDSSTASSSPRAFSRRPKFTATTPSPNAKSADCSISREATASIRRDSMRNATRSATNTASRTITTSASTQPSPNRTPRDSQASPWSSTKVRRPVFQVLNSTAMTTFRPPNSTPPLASPPGTTLCRSSTSAGASRRSTLSMSATPSRPTTATAAISMLPFQTPSLSARATKPRA